MQTRFSYGLWLLFGLFVSILPGCRSGGENPISPTPHATFTSLGFLPGDTFSQPTAVSSDGSVVVGRSTSSANTNRGQAFRWNAQQGMTGFGFLPGGTYSAAAAVSDDGSVVAGYGDSGIDRVGFRWTNSTGLVPLSNLGGSSICAASGVSGDGSIVVGTCLLKGDEAFRWTDGTGSVGISQMGTGSGGSSAASAVSSNGAVIVGCGQLGVIGAVLWTAGSSSVLGTPSGCASAVSRDGSVIVGNSNDKAFLWTQQSGMVDISEPLIGFSTSAATGVSGDGQRIVGCGTTQAGEAAFLWDAQHGMRLLDVVLSSDFGTEIKGWKLTCATAISGDGRTIVGYGINPGQQTEGWVLGLSN